MSETRTMGSSRRRGKADSATRSLILDSAENLIVEKGYAAVSSRRIAAEAQVSFQLVHYYFEAMDDLFVALIQRSISRSMQRLENISNSLTPLRDLWDMNKDTRGAALVLQFMALAMHSPKVHSAIAEFGFQFRDRQVTIVRDYLATKTGPSMPPGAVASLLEFTARMIVFDGLLGVSVGHIETLDVLEKALSDIESRADRT
jgi:AcrR family transcriptional regulator